MKDKKENGSIGGKLSNIRTILLFKTKDEMKTSKQKPLHQRKTIILRKIKPRMKQRVFKNEEIPMRKIKKDFAKFNLQPNAKNPLSST